MSADLIKRLRDELQSVRAVVQSLEIEGTHIFVDASLIAEADAHLSSAAVPETPGLVPVEPVAFCVYLPSMDTQEYFDDLDDLWCVDLLTNNPDAQVTPLYAQPKEPTT